nr:sulfatase-like hydrolase/transferase [Cytophagales bacterium]
MQKNPIYFVTLLCILVLSSSCRPAENSGNSLETPPPVNILFIAVDDLRPELGCYGENHIHSPNIDRLARRSVLFERAYCQQSVCSPSRTSVMTGLRPDITGIYDLQTHFRDVVPNVVTLPQHFLQHGYHTEFWGKIYHAALLDSASWSVGGNDQDRRIEPQWPMENWRAYALDTSNAIADLNNGGGLPYEMADLPDTAYPDGVIAARAIASLRQMSEQKKPFFLGIGFYKPHLPFNAPKKYWDMYQASDIILPKPVLPVGTPGIAPSNWGELRAYYSVPPEGDLDTALTRKLIHGYRACVSYVDAQVGKVLDELERLNLADNTIIVLWGDHGFKVGEYGDWCKHTNYEIDTRAPLMVCVPRMTDKGHRTASLVELVDIYPTLSELANLPKPAHLQGKSFVPVLQHPDQKWKEVALSQFPRNNGEVMGYSMRTEQYRYTRWEELSSGNILAQELYQHKDNSLAHQNLAILPEYESMLTELDTLLEISWRNSLLVGR